MSWACATCAADAPGAQLDANIAVVATHPIATPEGTPVAAGPIPETPAIPPTPTTAVVNGDPVDNDPPKTVRLIGVTTDVGTKVIWMTPNIPVPPFKGWHEFVKSHLLAVHCSLEWTEEKGTWFYAEMRSNKWDGEKGAHRVGLGQFPATGYVAYGIFITPGRYPRCIDKLGRPVTVTVDEVIKCDYKKVESELRKYGAYGKRPGDPGTGGFGKENVGLGGPAYKPGQNSNSMVNYVLRKCGVEHSAPELTVGWDRVPTFPYSSDMRYPKYGE
jgi:hypothetical protein